MERGDLETAASCYDEAAALFGRIGDNHGRNTALAHHAWVHVRRGELDAGLKESLQALAYARREGLARRHWPTVCGCSAPTTRHPDLPQQPRQRLWGGGPRG